MTDTTRGHAEGLSGPSQEDFDALKKRVDELEKRLESIGKRTSELDQRTTGSILLR